MKATIKTITLALAVVLMNSAFAQKGGSPAQKIGYIKIDSLIMMMPESQKASEEGAVFYKQLEQQIADMQNELKRKYDEYQQKKATAPPLVVSSLEAELNQMQQRLQDFQTNAQTEWQKKNQDLSRPIYEKANVAIKAVAKEGGYRFIFDSSIGNIIYAEPTDDVMSLVVKKLGIDPKAVKPLSPTSPTIMPPPGK